MGVRKKSCNVPRATVDFWRVLSVSNTSSRLFAAEIISSRACRYCAHARVVKHCCVAKEGVEKLKVFVWKLRSSAEDQPWYWLHSPLRNGPAQTTFTMREIYSKSELELGY